MCIHLLINLNDVQLNIRVALLYSCETLPCGYHNMFARNYLLYTMP